MNEKSPKDQRSAALKIAEAEIENHFPGHKRAGKELKLVRLDPVKDNSSRWYSLYDVESVEDASVEMVVDIETGQIISYKDQWV